MLDEESFLKVFRLFSFSLLCFFSLSRFALNFFFFGSARGFFFQQATTFDSSLKQTREKKEKDFETFLSLFFPLFDTNNTTLALTQRQRRRTKPCSFYSSSVCCKVLYREKDSKKRRAIDFDWFAHHPEAAAKNPKLTKRRLFSTHINISLSLSLSIGRYSAECVVLSL